MSSLGAFVQSPEGASVVEARFAALWTSVRRQHSVRWQGRGIAGGPRRRRLVRDISSDEETVLSSKRLTARRRRRRRTADDESVGESVMSGESAETSVLSTGSLDEWIVADDATSRALEEEEDEVHSDDASEVHGRWAARGAKLLRELRSRPGAKLAKMTSSSSAWPRQPPEQDPPEPGHFYATAGWGLALAADAQGDAGSSGSLPEDTVEI